MNKEWVEKKNQERFTYIQNQKQQIIDSINECDFLANEHKNQLINEIINYENSTYCTTHGFRIMLMRCVFNQVGVDAIEDFIDALQLDEYIMSLKYCSYNRYLDSEPVGFDGDIIITDPCYIIKHRDESTMPKWEQFMKLPSYQGMTREEMEAVGYFEDYARMREATDKWEAENPDDWDVCNDGHEMGELGFKTWMTRDTLDGDWSCTTFNSDTKQPIGKFCADSGMVGVFNLNEVLTYNPEYNDYVDKNWTATVIKDFKGSVQFVVEKNKCNHREDFNVKVVGRGINKVTGEPLNFVTSQTRI